MISLAYEGAVIQELYSAHIFSRLKCSHRICNSSLRQLQKHSNDEYISCENKKLQLKGIKCISFGDTFVNILL